MTSLIASAVGQKVYKIFAKDRNVLIPLDNISQTSILTDKQLKEKYKAREPIREPVKKKKRKNNLDKILERMSK